MKPIALLTISDLKALGYECAHVIMRKTGLGSLCVIAEDDLRGDLIDRWEQRARVARLDVHDRQIEAALRKRQR